MADLNITNKLSVWHDGEVRMQKSVGVDQDSSDQRARAIRDYMPDQHRSFYSQLPFIALGAVDQDERIWATFGTGKPGFLSSPDPKKLDVSLVKDPADPVMNSLVEGEAFGMLGIELHSRRRNRLNGHIAAINAGKLNFAVDQSFGNCPKYIQKRDFEFVREPGIFTDHPVTEQDGLSDEARNIIAAADTFFVASYVDVKDFSRQIDVSHRGGKPGFVRIDVDGTLTIPDFSGNLYFNTLGNFLVNPKAGLLFPDFENGTMLHLTGSVEVILDSPEVEVFHGAERIWKFRPEKMVLRPDALPLRWTMQDEGWSPSIFTTGDWQEAEEKVKAQTLRETWRPYKISKIVDESAIIRSFYLEPTDGASIVGHEAGQHLPIRVAPKKEEKPLVRTYSLSTAPADGAYRISVKRQGLVSSYLHDDIGVGDILEARAPAGNFTIGSSENRGAVLIAAGVGITPLLAMLRHNIYEGLRTGTFRPTWVFYAARSKAERAFDAEIADLAKASDGWVNVIRILELQDGAREGHDYDETGRIDMPLLKATLPFGSYDFYLCGPPPFMQNIYNGLRSIDVNDIHIHAEAFGPASLERKPDGDVDVEDLPSISPEPVSVVFEKSNKEARWEPGAGSLLDLAETNGLAPEFSCRGGNCGTCAVKVVQGSVTYKNKPAGDVAEDEALICCAVPAVRNATSDADFDSRLILDL